MTRDFVIDLDGRSLAVEYELVDGRAEIGTVRQADDGLRINVNLQCNTNLRRKLEDLAWEDWQADLASMAESRAADEYDWRKFERGGADDTF